MGTTKSGNGILAEEMRDERERVVGMLTKAYWMEIETVMSYLANSTNPDGVRAQEIIKSLREDVRGVPARVPRPIVSNCSAATQIPTTSSTPARALFQPAGKRVEPTLSSQHLALRLQHPKPRLNQSALIRPFDYGALRLVRLALPDAWAWIPLGWRVASGVAGAGHVDSHGPRRRRRGREARVLFGVF
jgi:hypothetical protein